MSLKNKLNRMKTHMDLQDSEKKGSPVEGAKKQLHEKNEGHLELPFSEKWQQFDTLPYKFDESYCWIREVRYPIEMKHGHYSFADLHTVIDLWQKSGLNHPLTASGIGTEDLFFFDTETTGLGGGVGNTIFILGYASFEKDEVVVRQHILPQPGAEIPLYQSFLEKVNYETLVTYNGKSFDWPQLKTRHRLIQQHVPNLPEFGHFDLYHASRRLWKRKLEKVKLSIVETEILGVKRENDIPGYLAPMIYFDYVERQDPEILFGVLKHNEWDVLSLITLYIHLSRQILQVDGYGDESLEMARWFRYLGKKEEAYKTFELVVKEGSEDEILFAKQALGFAKKKNKNFNEAYSIWIEVFEKGNGMLKVEAGIECAKLLEHQFKDYELAKKYTADAMDTLSGLSKYKDTLIVNELTKRLLRLQRKLQVDSNIF
ncbi:ribonuclease H-like domain-containing protein [Peribacillus loiseleuriae]|uniref:ribonuclease H-like domain-containing protein n=1 Tax=Peribacillus loiseleuriae TaxID=1679170 RepID=UPI003D02E245